MGKPSPSGIFEILMSDNERDVLYKIVRDLKPNVAVEIGSWTGGSSTIIVNAGADYLFCVDTWDHYYDTAGFGEERNLDYSETGFGKLSADNRFATFCDNTKNMLFHRLFPCRGTSVLWSSLWTLPIDFLFIDGCHTYESVKADIEGWYPHVRDGGVILGHDYLKVPQGNAEFIWEFPGVAKAVHESFANFYVIPGTTFWMVRKGGVGHELRSSSESEGSSQVGGQVAETYVWRDQRSSPE